MFWIAIFILFVYSTLIGEFILAYERVEDVTPSKLKSDIGFTLIIPFRNEAVNLPQLLACLAALDYPLEYLEILLVNDASEDNSVEIIDRFIINHPSVPLALIENQLKTGSPKKDALTTAIHQSKFDWIVTTDADCTFPQNWLQELASFISTRRPKMVVGPVRIETTVTPNFLNAFEQLDFLSLMGATLGGFGMRKPFLCNGAHLAYEKKAFLEVEGFVDNDHIASGDDHFLLEKFTKRFPNFVMYFKTRSAIVTTEPQENWAAFIGQRIRWASKATGYSYWFSKFVGLIVLLTNLIVIGILGYFTVSLIDGIVHSGSFEAFAKAISNQLLVFAVFAKLFADYLLIARTARLLDRLSYLRWFLPVALSYPFVSGYIALRALTSDFSWKGRRYKR